jgi:WD40 repeat protein
MKAAVARLKPLTQCEVGDFPVDAQFSPNARAMVVACGDGEIKRVNLDDEKTRVATLGQHAGGALALAWQSAGQLFASSGQDGEVRLWDARTGTGHCIHAEAEWSEQLAFSSSGALLAVATGKRLTIYDAAGAEAAAFNDHPGTISAIAWKPKSTEIAAVFNGGARIHSAQPPTQTLELPWKGACLTAGWSPDGRLLASGLQDGSVHFWYVAAGKQSEMKGYGSKVRLTSWNAAGRFLATAADESIVVWNCSGRGPEGSEPIQLRAHTARITQLAFAPQCALLATAALDRRLLLWQPGVSDQPLDADLLSDDIALLRWSRDGQMLAVGNRNGTITLYTVAA